MVLKIRLARFGKRHAPVYNIVVAHARTARNSRPLEVIGTYDPIPKLARDAPPHAKKIKDIRLDTSRAKYWLGVGAQPTDTAWRLLSMIGLLEPKFAGVAQASLPRTQPVDANSSSSSGYSAAAASDTARPGEIPGSTETEVSRTTP